MRSWLEKIILENYVDPVDPNIASVDSLAGMDPHTRYLPKKTIEKHDNRLEGKTVSHEFMLPDMKTGYIKLDIFRKSSAAEIREAIRTLKNQGMQQLILDLRYNGGGYLSAAVEIADEFLPQGKLIVFKEGRTPSSYQEFYSENNPMWEGPLIILMNYESASAAEIVAGAIQDYDRGVIVGELSFGKGLVQKKYRFTNEDELLITVSCWNTPSGRNIQRRYKPWEQIAEYNEQAYDLEARVAALDTLPKKSTVGGRLLPEHSGIIPDTTISAGPMPKKEIRKLVDEQGQTLSLFAERYVREHNIKYTLKEFIVNFEVDDATVAAFKKMIAGTDSMLAFKINDPEFDDELKSLLRREIGLARYGPQGYWELDDQLRKAAGVFQESNRLLTRKDK